MVEFEPDLNFSLAHRVKNNITLFYGTKSEFIHLSLSIGLFMLGLIGNLSIAYLFSIKYKNHSSVLLVVLALNDSFFLTIHLIEDITQLTELFLGDKYSLVKSLNLYDRYEATCLLISYLRYVFQSISSYLIMLITIDRFIISLKSLVGYQSFQEVLKKIISITILSALINVWVPFIYQNQAYSNLQNFCEINFKYRVEYFQANIIMISLVCLIPAVIIIVISPITLYNLMRKTSSRFIKAELVNTETLDENLVMTFPARLVRKKNKAKPIQYFYLALSFAFVISNLPYYFVWVMYYIKMSSNNLDVISDSKLINYVQITYFIYVLSFGLKFYILCFVIFLVRLFA